jgi:hypothetical protein
MSQTQLIIDKYVTNFDTIQSHQTGNYTTVGQQYTDEIKKNRERLLALDDQQKQIASTRLQLASDIKNACLGK